MSPKPEDFDFPESGTWREFHAEARPLPKLKKRQPKTIQVAGMTLHNIDPNATPDETTYPKVVENLQKLGIGPKQETTPPPTAPATEHPAQSAHSIPKEYPEKRIDTVNRVLNKGGVQGEIERDRLLMPYAYQDASTMRKKRRTENGLPEKAAPWKEIQRDFKALTPDQINFLREIGFHPERVTNPHSETVELMLLRLKQYGKL